MQNNKRSRNKISIYIKDAELTKISYYKDIFKQVHKVDLNVSSILQMLINGNKSIDDLISDCDRLKQGK
jgi:hypothetical protein